MASQPLRKKLTYRDNSNRTQAEHAALWAGFSWQAGPVIVKADGPWGQLQVWAATEAEGRRVIAHAASAGGWNLAAQGVEWTVKIATGGRNGRTGRMVTKVTPLGTEVIKRDGPSGYPLLSS